MNKLLELKEEINQLLLFNKMIVSLKATAVEGGFVSMFKCSAVNNGSVGQIGTPQHHSLFRDLFIVFHLMRSLVEIDSTEDRTKEPSLADYNGTMCLVMSLKDKDGWEIGKVSS